MVSGNYRTGRRRVTWSIFELRSIVHGRFVFISTGNSAGLRHSKSMPEVGLRGLGQGSQIRTRSRGGVRQGRDMEFQKWKLRFVGGQDTRWKSLEGAWVVRMRGSKFQCYTECNRQELCSY